MTTRWHPWRITNRLGFASVPILRQMWTRQFREGYLKEWRLLSIRNNLYLMARRRKELQ